MDSLVSLTYRPEDLTKAWAEELACAFVLEADGTLALINANGELEPAGFIGQDGSWHFAAEQRREPRFFAHQGEGLEIRVGNHILEIDIGVLIGRFNDGKLTLLELHSNRFCAQVSDDEWLSEGDLHVPQLIVCPASFPLEPAAALGPRQRPSALAD